MEGALKQQCIDDFGLYDWIKKYFILRHDTSSLIINHNNETLELSLSGAKYAKEWNISSAIAGYGFDIVWHSGKLWSFLADDDVSCRKWVEELNKCFQRMNATITDDSHFQIINHEPLDTTNNAQVLGQSEKVLSGYTYLFDQDMRHNNDSITGPNNSTLNDNHNRSTTSLNNLSTSQNTYVANHIGSFEGKVATNTYSSTERFVKPSETHQTSFYHRGQPNVISTDEVSHSSSSIRHNPSHGHDMNESRTITSTPDDDTAADISTIRLSSYYAKPIDNLLPPPPISSNKQDKYNIENKVKQDQDYLFSQSQATAYQEQQSIQVQLQSVQQQLYALQQDYSHMIYEHSLKEEKIKQFEATKWENEKDKLQSQYLEEIASIHKQHEEMIRKIHIQEKRVYEKEIDTIKQIYQSREKETAQDLLHLEALHTQRIAELEHVVHELTETVDRLKQENSYLIKNQTHVMKKHEREMNDQMTMMTELKTQIDQTVTHTQESKSKEATYRKQLQELIEKMRVIHAQYLEYKQQAESAQSEVEQLKLTIQSQELTQSSRVATLQIAHDEIHMLENEVKRLSSMVQILEKTVDKYEHIIYGKSLHTKLDNQSYIMNHNTVNTTSTGQHPLRTSLSKSKHMVMSTPTSTAAVKTNRKESMHSNTHLLSFSSIAHQHNKANTLTTPVSATPNKKKTSSNPNTTSSKNLALKWRDGCTRTPIRCGASSLMLLPTDIIAEPVASTTSKIQVKKALKKKLSVNDTFFTTDFKVIPKNHIKVDESVLSRIPLSTAKYMSMPTPSSLPDMPIAGYY